MAGDAKKVVALCYATVTEQLTFREFEAPVIDLVSTERDAWSFSVQILRIDRG
jgi:hypothetical protein